MAAGFFVRRFSMNELSSFYNDGTGWVCRQCERDLAQDAVTDDRHSRVFREGEAESKAPTLAGPTRPADSLPAPAVESQKAWSWREGPEKFPPFHGSVRFLLEL